MKLSFRNNHILKILNSFAQTSLPLDLFLSSYFRNCSSIGSKDRKFIAEKIYHIIRWKSLIDFHLEKPISDEKRIELLETLDLKKASQNKDIPLHIRAGFSKNYFEMVENTLLKNALNFCHISNEKAPTTIRANTLKISRDDLFDRFSKNYRVEKTLSENGIVFLEKINFFSLLEFKEGFFEIQDEGSQMIADLVIPDEKSTILDYCAGAGGKTLAFAPKMKNKGQIYLHDVRKKALEQAKKRLKRAGIQNFQIADAKKLKKLKSKIDILFLDVPCSGSGTLRRNPDMKWKFTKEDLLELIEKQRAIFKNAFDLVKQGGTIIYATCSIFKEENKDQTKYFLKNYSLKLEKELSFLPEKEGKDGFFAAVLKKN